MCLKTSQNPKICVKCWPQNPKYANENVKMKKCENVKYKNEKICIYQKNLKNYRTFFTFFFNESTHFFFECTNFLKKM